MSSAGLTIQQTEVIGLVFPILAAVVTSFRLFERTRQGRLWLDDAWAALAMLFNIVFLVVNWLYLHDFARYSQNSIVIIYYLVAQFFYAVVWASRISILFTIIRLAVPGPLRRLLVFIAGAFMVTWMVLLAQVFWTCETEPGWKTLPRPQCDLGRNVAIAQIITDVFGDMILILAPFRLIYKVRLTRAQKIRVLSIFSASAITTVVSLTHAYYVLNNGGLKEATAALFEASISLIVANLNVVVAFLFRISTDETAKPAPLQLRSIITFGSLNRKKSKPELETLSPTMVGVETTTLRTDDLTVSPKRTIGGDSSDGDEVTLVKPSLLPDV